jgi:hypothetical protein
MVDQLGFWEWPIRFEPRLPKRFAIFGLMA